MCGRYASTRSAADLAALFEAEDLTDGDLVPAYNIAPTDPAPIVRLTPGGPVLCAARWGFLPPWARDPAGSGPGEGRPKRGLSAGQMINARAETVASSRAYGEAFAHRRCLVPADGWFEWLPGGRSVGGAGGMGGRSVGGAGRQAYFLTRTGPLAFGGVWTASRADAQMRITFSIVTVPAIGPLATIHERMPMVIDESRWSQWLTCSHVATLLTPPSSEYCAGFELRPVSSAVGDVRKDGPELLQRVVIVEDDPSTVDQSPTLF
ncbi:MAG TPA: SOS response-associated peptidase [Micromonosporaceae bacterium]|jgi:putative SOS response-associated peptidase YedK